MLTQQRLKELLHYDPITGVLTWRITKCKGRRGARAGYVLSSGYRILGLDGTRYSAHRLIWLYVYGVWPVEELDHGDCDRDNNAFANLREASRADNRRNTRAKKNSVSGLKGVSFDITKIARPWVARIGINHKYKFLGCFATRHEAHRAYASAAQRYFGVFARAA